ncbi:MAG: ABC-F family ATP-binding cassette domain-containing protein [Anaerolineae bacterium]
MQLIHLNNVTVNFAGREIFRDLSWAIADRARIGLMGPSGAGKSSLLRLITGAVEPDSGQVRVQRGVSLGFLPQDVHLPPGRTLLEEAMVMPPKLAALDAALAKVEAALASPEVYGDERRLTQTLERQARLLDAYEEAGGPRFESKVREILNLLGFSAADYALDAETLSGGQKKLVLLARLAAQEPDVLLMDEPDNHLDVASKRRLERFIAGYPGAVVIVSHDRYLLDEVASEIAELEAGRLTIYPGNYTAYATERELRRLRQQQAYTAQQKEIARIEAAIARFEHWASLVVDERHIRQARSRRRMLERMEERGEVIERVTERRQMDLQLNGWRGSKKALEIEGLAAGFDDDLLFMDVDLLVRHGERVGLVGPNGIGKSVLFKIVLGQIDPLAGSVKVGNSTRIGYYSQEHQTLTPWLERTPLEMVRDIRPSSENAGVAVLLKFLFTYEQVRQPIRTMSGGERSCLQLAALMLQNPNLLLLDEPTNNLDIPSVEALESALEDFEGAVLVISHDRYFLDQVVDRIVELTPEGLRSYEGGYTDYLLAAGHEA